MSNPMASKFQFDEIRKREETEDKVNKTKKAKREGLPFSYAGKKPFIGVNAIVIGIVLVNVAYNPDCVHILDQAYKLFVKSYELYVRKILVANITVGPVETDSFMQLFNEESRTLLDKAVEKFVGEIGAYHDITEFSKESISEAWQDLVNIISSFKSNTVKIDIESELIRRSDAVSMLLRTTSFRRATEYACRDLVANLGTIFTQCEWMYFEQHRIKVTKKEVYADIERIVSITNQYKRGGKSVILSTEQILDIQFKQYDRRIGNEDFVKQQRHIITMNNGIIDRLYGGRMDIALRELVYVHLRVYTAELTHYVSSEVSIACFRRHQRLKEYRDYLSEVNPTVSQVLEDTVSGQREHFRISMCEAAYVKYREKLKNQLDRVNMTFETPLVEVIKALIDVTSPGGTYRGGDDVIAGYIKLCNSKMNSVVKDLIDATASVPFNSDSSN